MSVVVINRDLGSVQFQYNKLALLQQEYVLFRESRLAEPYCCCISNKAMDGGFPLCCTLVLFPYFQTFSSGKNHISPFSVLGIDVINLINIIDIIITIYLLQLLV